MAYAYADCPREDILRMVPPDGTVIGSIGCGYATTEHELVKAGRTVHGADVAAEVEEVARGRLTTFALIKPGEKVPWAEGSLDGLILADVLEHIPGAWEALGGFSRLVKPGGWVVISVPNMRGVEVMSQFIWGGDWPERDTGIFDRTHIQMMSQKRLARWCGSAGLRVEKWFDRYDPNGPRRYRFFRTMDLLTLKLMHGWFMYQVQCRCRRTGEGGA
jgi:2-polyprenyl-3-methyl-5-hydroxy-6-metoxy-1,4-benzoquinol methylase